MAKWQANWWVRNKKTQMGDWSVTDGRTQITVNNCKVDSERHEKVARFLCNALNQTEF